MIETLLTWFLLGLLIACGAIAGALSHLAAVDEARRAREEQR